MAKKISPTDIYKLLPKKNCGECGVPTCMAFAFKIVEGKANPSQCPYLSEEAKDALLTKTAPPVVKVEIGTGRNKVVIGGEKVAFRHEEKFYNEALFAVEISDRMSSEEIIEKIKEAEEFRIERMGQTLKLNMFAVKSVSGNAEKFVETLKIVKQHTNLPLILCSTTPYSLMKALEFVGEDKPLICPVTSMNVNQMAVLAKKFKTPVAVHGSNLEEVKTLITRLNQFGVNEILIIPPGQNLMDEISSLTIIRRGAVEKKIKTLGYPTLVFPNLIKVNNGNFKDYWEVMASAAFLLRYGGIIILSNIVKWAVLPLMLLRQAIYIDPRIPLQIKPGLYVIGSPDENSPVMMTTNYSLTYHIVSNDLKIQGISTYLLVVDTGGLSVNTSVAGNKINPDSVARLIKENRIEEKVKHKKIIIPGRAAKLGGEIEDVSGWEVLVGPFDSREIKGFLEKKWLRQ